MYHIVHLHFTGYRIDYTFIVQSSFVALCKRIDVNIYTAPLLFQLCKPTATIHLPLFLINHSAQINKMGDYCIPSCKIKVNRHLIKSFKNTIIRFASRYQDLTIVNTPTLASLSARVDL